MYDMYPDTWGQDRAAEWGPASHHPDNPHSAEAATTSVWAAFDPRDGDGSRPDDN